MSLFGLAFAFAFGIARAQQHEQNPQILEFKGFVLGDTLEHFKVRFPGFCEKQADGRESCYLSSSLCAELRDQSSMCRNKRHPITEFAGGNLEGVHALIKNDRVDTLALTIGPAYYDTVVSAISSKYGPVTRQSQYKLRSKRTDLIETLPELLWDVGGGVIKVRTKDLRDPSLMSIWYWSPAAVASDAALDATRSDRAKSQL